MAKPDPTLLIDVVAPRVLSAMKLASEALAAANVRHVVVGGLAVGANGFPRATKDVAFLVGAEAFCHHASGLVTMRPEVPFQVHGVAVDLLSVGAGEEFLEETLVTTAGAFIEAPPLVYLKLKSPRLRDHVDVVEMIKGGIDTSRCRAYLAAHAPGFVAGFDQCVAEAEAEQD